MTTSVHNPDGVRLRDVQGMLIRAKEDFLARKPWLRVLPSKKNVLVRLCSLRLDTCLSERASSTGNGRRNSSKSSLQNF